MSRASRLAPRLLRACVTSTRVLCLAASSCVCLLAASRFPSRSEFLAPARSSVMCASVSFSRVCSISRCASIVAIAASSLRLAPLNIGICCTT